ncbi:MAG: TOBE-like domain-containing protein, partial [Cucumibacter sp.]
IVGTVVASRRIGGVREVELEAGGGRERLEIEIPVDHPATARSRVAFRPKRWRLYGDRPS